MRFLGRFVRFLPRIGQLERRFVNRAGRFPVKVLVAFAGGGSLVASGFLAASKTGIMNLSAEELQVRASHKLTKREIRFLQFASVEYDDVIYMTPMDFVDSLTLDAPRERVYRRVLSKENVEAILKKTPPFKKGSRNFFRELDQNGIISYSEYLFLITLLTKSQASFKIAFQLFDSDGNQKIDKEEFMLIRSLVNTLRSSRKQKVEDDPCQLNPADFDDLVLRLRDRLHPTSDPIPELLERLMNKQMSHMQRSVKTEDERRYSQELELGECDAHPQKDANIQETTILSHLFGPKGNNSLGFDQFQIFYSNLQRELMEIEFHEFSRGKPEISPMNFARLVLRYSVIHQDDYTTYINRVQERSSPNDNGITLEQFEEFSLFLNNLAEFTVAVRLYTAADMPVSRSEFIRAVKCSTGHELDPHLVDFLYRIFDSNGDGRLSYSEFIAVMNDRLHRGFKSTNKISAGGWKPFRDCVISELARF